MSREDDFASFGTVFDFEVTFGGFGQRAIRRIEQPGDEFDRQFVAHVSGAGEERQLSFRVAAFERGLPLAFVVQDRRRDARSIPALFDQTVKLIARARRQRVAAFERQRDRIDIGPALADALDQIDFDRSQRSGFDNAKNLARHGRLRRPQRLSPFKQHDRHAFGGLNRLAVIENPSDTDFQRQRVIRTINVFGHFNLLRASLVDLHPGVSLDGRRHLIVRKSAAFGQGCDDLLAVPLTLFFFKRAPQSGDGARVAIFGQGFGGDGAVFRVFVVVQNPDQSRREFGRVQAGQTADEFLAIFFLRPVRFGQQGGELLRDVFLLLFITGSVGQESDQVSHRRLVNRAMIVADEGAYDREAIVCEPVNNEVKNAESELRAKVVYRTIVYPYCALRAVSPCVRFVLRFGCVFNFFLKTADRRVGEERNEPLVLPAPLGIHQTRQGFQPRGRDRLAVLDDRLQKRAIAFGPRRIPLLRGVFVKQG